jgi:ABC-2 type transport system ATP-binding protein
MTYVESENLDNEPNQKVQKLSTDPMLAKLNPNLIVETRALSKSYGDFVALNSVNLQIERGAIFGFIGPNGAGKTTTMRILATLLEPSKGQAWVNGFSVNDQKRSNIEAIRRTIGFMPDYFGIYEKMKSWEYLDFFASAYFVDSTKRERLITDLLELVDLSDKRNSYIENLSRGMKQRLGLARTLVHDPNLLILDEPASGLDPRARVELRELLKELSKMGKTIIISSHILTELAEMCTHIGIIERGVLLAQGRVSDILRQMRTGKREVEIRVNLTAGQSVDFISKFLSKAPGVSKALVIDEENPHLNEENQPTARWLLEIAGGETALHQLLKNLIKQNIAVYSFAEREDNLEDIFMRVTRGLVN